MFEDKIVYQIYPKSFMDSNNDGIGDLQGIISKLDYIKDLGADYIWLSPINTSPQYDNGYDISDYYGIDPIFGTLDEYKCLIESANKKGLKVMLDLVLNHTSSEHEWFKKAVAGDKKYKDYYIWRDEPNELIGYFSESAWSYNADVGQYYFHLFDKHQPDLNWENPEVRSEIYKMVNYWIELGVEGFRLDVIDLIGKEPDKLITGKGPKFYDYLKELNNNTFKNEILTVGECWMSSHEDSLKMCSDDGLSQIFHFTPLCLTNGEDKWEQHKIDFNQVIDVIANWQNNYLGSQTQVMNNHDMPRLVSLWLDDQTYRYEACTNLAMLFGLLKGTQYIYQGEEIGMVNDLKRDINLYNDVETLNKYKVYKSQAKLSEEEIMQRINLISRDNARTPMQWSAEVNAGFSKTTPWLNLNYRYQEINVENDLKSNKSVYKFYQQLITFKKDNYEDIINKNLDYITYDNEIITYKKGSLIVYLNMSNQQVDCEVIGTIVLNNYHQINDYLLPYQAVATIVN